MHNRAYAQQRHTQDLHAVRAYAHIPVEWPSMLEKDAAGKSGPARPESAGREDDAHPDTKPHHSFRDIAKLDDFSLNRFPFANMSDHLQVSAGYQALHDGAAWLDLANRGRIRVTGEDRARLLHAMTTQNVQQMQPGDGCYLFFLNAQGRILGDANLFCFADYFLLDTEPETRQKLYEHIDRYIIADDVTLEDVTESTSAISIEGPSAREVLGSFGVTLPERDRLTVAWGDRVIAKTSTSAVDGFMVLLPTASPTTTTDAFTASLGIPQATAEDARLVRLENGRPRYGEEITERYLVHETGQLHAVNFNKGCYLGQEIVERVRSRAQIHRVLRSLLIESPNAPAAGTHLVSQEAAAGEIVNAAFSPALGKVVAMAYVKIPFAEPGTELQAGDAVARIT